MADLFGDAPERGAPEQRLQLRSPTSETLDFRRQLRNLLLLRPLYELALKSRRGEESDLLFDGVDTQYIALAILDFVMEGGALGQGRTHDETVHQAAAIARRMKPALSEAQSKTVGLEVLNAITNAPRYAFFKYPFFDAVSGQTEEVSFALMRYEMAEDNAYYYRLTDDGFVVYLGMLDLGAADMQELMEKMLHELIRRGRVKDAVEVSKQAYGQAQRFFNAIRQSLDRAARVPDRFRWYQHIEPEIAKAREHLDARNSEQSLLIGIVNEKLRESNDSVTRQRLVSLHDTLDKEQGLGANLDTLIAQAAARYMQAQAVSFRARPMQRFPDLETKLLPDLLNQSVTDLAESADVYGYQMVSAATPRLFDIATLMQRLLEPEPEGTNTAEEEVERVPIEDLPLHFSPADHAEAQRFLGILFAKHPVSDIPGVLKAAEDAGLSPRIQQLMVFRMYQAFSRDESTFPVSTRPDGRFEHALVSGSNLVFRREGEKSE